MNGTKDARLAVMFCKTGVDVCINIMLRGAAQTAEDLVSVTADK
ncbi:hypothetical protein [Paenibacillus sp. 23TSA30-6]|nr:hypothetical protein [Paenibacillus sp. 23TSA30-6]